MWLLLGGVAFVASVTACAAALAARRWPVRSRRVADRGDVGASRGRLRDHDARGGSAYEKG